MRKELRAAVRKEFAAAMARRLPQFVPLTVKSRFAWPGSRIYEWAYNPSIHFFVELFFDPKGYDCFGVDLGWSTLGRFPEIAARTGYREDTGKAQEWLRLPLLYSNFGGMWSLEAADEEPGAIGQGGGSVLLAAGLPAIPIEQALTRVGPRVGDAVEKLVVYALPYCEEVSRLKSSS
jgi:hypothetical protein